jgi:hypothetical protein
MRKLFLVWAAVSILVFPSVISKASQGETSEKQILKSRQKEERKALKLKDHYAKQAFKGQAVPKGVSDQRKHELQREKRALRDRQKDENQDLKDRQKLMKESMKRQD